MRVENLADICGNHVTFAIQTVNRVSKETKSEISHDDLRSPTQRATKLEFQMGGRASKTIIPDDRDIGESPKLALEQAKAFCASEGVRR